MHTPEPNTTSTTPNAPIGLWAIALLRRRMHLRRQLDLQVEESSEWSDGAARPTSTYGQVASVWRYFENVPDELCELRLRATTAVSDRHLRYVSADTLPAAQRMGKQLDNTQHKIKACVGTTPAQHLASVFSWLRERVGVGSCMAISARCGIRLQGFVWRAGGVSDDAGGVAEHVRGGQTLWAGAV